MENKQIRIIWEGLLKTCAMLNTETNEMDMSDEASVV